MSTTDRVIETRRGYVALIEDDRAEVVIYGECGPETYLMVAAELARLGIRASDDFWVDLVEVDSEDDAARSQATRIRPYAPVAR